jgi:hypothetical protein
VQVSDTKNQALVARGEASRARGILHIIRIPNENPRSSNDRASIHNVISEGAIGQVVVASQTLTKIAVSCTYRG